MRFSCFMRLATSLALLKLHNFYITLVLKHKWYYSRNTSTYHIKLECGQLAPRSALSHNTLISLNVPLLKCHYTTLLRECQKRYLLHKKHMLCVFASQSIQNIWFNGKMREISIFCLNLSRARTKT